MAVMEATAEETRMADPRQNQQANDALLPVEFFIDAEYQEEESELAKRPIYKDKEFIHIRVPGDKDNDVIRRVRPTDKLRWSQRYQAFLANKSQDVTGTPLEQWTQITPSLVKELQYINVRTVEQLANLPDSQAQQLRDPHTLRARAKAWLNAAAGVAESDKMAQLLAQRDEMIASMAKRLEALEAGPKDEPKVDKRTKEYKESVKEPSFQVE